MTGKWQNRHHDAPVCRPPDHGATKLLQPEIDSYWRRKNPFRAASSAAQPQRCGDDDDGQHADRGSAADFVHLDECLSFVALGVASCLEYRGRRALRPWKSSEQMCGRPNNCSVLPWPTSPGRSGQRALRQISPPQQAAAFAPPNFIWPGIAIGLAMRWLRSLLKFSPVTKCETSVSVHGKRRRAF
jgi:hypothetical protein